MKQHIAPLLCLSFAVISGPAAAQSDRFAPPSRAEQAPPIVQGDLRRFTQIPASCEAARDAGSQQTNDPLSRRRAPGPSCQAALECRYDLLALSAQLAAFLNANPEVSDELLAVGARSPTGRSQVSTFVSNLKRGAPDLSRIADTAPCDYVWRMIDNSWIGLDSRRPSGRPFEAFAEAGKTLIANTKSAFEASAQDYRALTAFVDRYPGIERFEQSYRRYADAINADSTAASLRARQTFLRESETARGRKQLLNDQTDALSRLITYASDTQSEYARDRLAKLSARDIQPVLTALRDEATRYRDMEPRLRGDVSSPLKSFAANRTEIDNALAPARAKRLELVNLDKRRQAALDNIATVLSLYDSDRIRARLTSEMRSTLASLSETQGKFKRLADTDLTERADYEKDLTFAEEDIEKLTQIHEDITLLNRLADGLAALKAKIKARGEQTLDANSRTELKALEKDASQYLKSSPPLTSEEREVLIEPLLERLDRFAGTAEAIMDMGSLAPEARTILEKHPEYKDQERLVQELTIYFTANTVLDYCNGQALFGFGSYRKTAAEARRRFKALEDILVRIHHKPAADIEKWKAAMEEAKAQILHPLKWDRRTPPEKTCDELVMFLQLKEPW